MCGRQRDVQLDQRKHKGVRQVPLDDREERGLQVGPPFQLPISFLTTFVLTRLYVCCPLAT